MKFVSIFVLFGILINYSYTKTFRKTTDLQKCKNKLTSHLENAISDKIGKLKNTIDDCGQDYLRCENGKCKWEDGVPCRYSDDCQKGFCCLKFEEAKKLTGVKPFDSKEWESLMTPTRLGYCHKASESVKAHCT